MDASSPYQIRPRFILGDLVTQSITQLNETIFQMSEEDNTSDIIVLSTSIISASDLTKKLVEYIPRNEYTRKCEDCTQSNEINLQLKDISDNLKENYNDLQLEYSLLKRDDLTIFKNQNKEIKMYIARKNI